MSRSHTYKQYSLASDEALVSKYCFILKKVLGSCKESGVTYIFFVRLVSE